MNEVLITDWILVNGVCTFSRSGGPGGQNVNKVSSATTIHVNLHRLEGVSDTERARLFQKLANRINSEGELVVRAEDSRSQPENRRLAQGRSLALILQALHRDKPRRATKPSRASQQRRVASKKITGTHKKNRGKPGVE